MYLAYAPQETGATEAMACRYDHPTIPCYLRTSVKKMTLLLSGFVRTSGGYIMAIGRLSPIRKKLLLFTYFKF